MTHRTLRRLAVLFNLLAAAYWSVFAVQDSARIGAVNDLTLSAKLLGGLLMFSITGLAPTLAVIALVWTPKRTL
jgi:hypothetical protein